MSSKVMVTLLLAMLTGCASLRATERQPGAALARTAQRLGGRLRPMGNRFGNGLQVMGQQHRWFSQQPKVPHVPHWVQASHLPGSVQDTLKHMPSNLLGSNPNYFADELGKDKNAVVYELAQKGKTPNKYSDLLLKIMPLSPEAATELVGQDNAFANLKPQDDPVKAAENELTVMKILKEYFSKGGKDSSEWPVPKILGQGGSGNAKGYMMSTMPGITLNEAMDLKEIPMANGDTTDHYKLHMKELDSLAHVVRGAYGDIWDAGVAIDGLNYDNILVSRKDRLDGTGWDFQVQVMDLGSSSLDKRDRIPGLKEKYSEEAIFDQFTEDFVNKNWR